MFPQQLEGKLISMVKELNDFMTESSFVCKTGDLAAEIAADPALDASDWEPLVDRQLKRDQGVTWVRCTFTVPESCMDVSIEGSQLRVMTDNGTPFFAPLEVYIDGELKLKEKSWLDFKCPECIVTQSAVPGRKHTSTFRFDFNDKCYWTNQFTMKVVSDRVEDNAYHISSIIDELKYMEHYSGTETALDQAYELLEKAADSGLISEVRKAETECRSLFEPWRDEVKKNRIYLVGHAHIDMNWFWSMDETRNIIERDFTTMTNLMEKYPDLKFSQSQCAAYEIAQERCPDVFQKMQALEADNRWDVTASTWVEGDLNMVQGESIVRHMLYSGEYLKDKFSKLPRIMWCPDTFGHPGSMPQILKKSGLDYYYHMRCGLGVGSYQDRNMNYLTDSMQTPVYWWKGIDGSRVLVYNSIYTRTIKTDGLLKASLRMNDFGIDKAMLLYGVGDHGGGPTERDIRWIQTIKDYPTVPELYFSTTEEYYRAIENGEYEICERCGEMNFVFDGCYTTHADVKRENRLCEEGLLATEELCVIAAQYGVPYPYMRLKDLWKRTLFNQFHDILDGSGVPDTYVFTMDESEKVLNGLRELKSKALQKLAEHFGVAQKKSFLIYNPTGFARDETIQVRITKGKGYIAADTAGTQYPCQCEEDMARVYLPDIPASSLQVIVLSETDNNETMCGHIKQDDLYYTIDTRMYEIEIRKDNGQITTLYDVCNDWYVVRREEIGWRLKKGVLNSLQVHMEEPTPMSSWTIGNVRTIHNLLSGAKSQIIYDGPVECCIRFTHQFNESTISQDIIINQHQRDIRFRTIVDWKEWGNFDRDAPMLKAYFTPDITNGTAVYEIPFGTVERPANDNEYPSLNWVDIHDDKHGFALLNDCKHGYKCRGNALEITLIRSGWLPDPKSDIGRHEFTYAILPHTGSWEDAGIIAAGQALNQPLEVIEASGTHHETYSLINCEGVVLSNIKKAEFGSGVIARLYNPGAEPRKASIGFGFDVESISETDLMENKEIASFPHDGRKVQVEFGPYEMKSLRIKSSADFSRLGSSGYES